MNKLRILLGFFISLLFIYFILYKPQIAGVIDGEISIIHGLFGQTRIDFTQTWIYLKKAAPLPLVVCFLITPIHVFIRSHRWVLLIKPVGRVKLIDSFSLQMLGYMANTIFPMRLGEVARGILLGKKIKIPTSTALATVVVERLLDVLSLLAVFVLVGLFYSFPEGFVKGAITLGIGALGLLVIILYYSLAKDPLGGITGKILSVLPVTIREKIKSIIRGFIDGFSMLKSGRHYPKVVLETVLLWVLYGLQEFSVLVAFGFHRDYALIAASPVVATLVILAVVAVVLSIPSAPGGIGTFHAAAIFALSLFGVGMDRAVGFALVIHALTISCYLGCGMLFMWREGLHMGELRRMNDEG